MVDIIKKRKQGVNAMKNYDMPAMPCEIKIYGEESMYYPDGIMMCSGLTKREMFAMHFMASCRIGRNYASGGEMSADAADMADALLKELDKQK